MWGGVANSIVVNRFSRQESIAFLRNRTGQHESESVDALSEAVGDLPFALAQAASYIDAAAISIPTYVDRFRKYSNRLLRPVETTWALSFDRLRRDAPGAADLLNVIAYFAPDKIPRYLLESMNDDPITFDMHIEALRRHSFVQVDDEALSVHRLTQEITRLRQSKEERRQSAEAAVNLIYAAFPIVEYSSWQTCAKLADHALQAVRHAEELDVALAESSGLLNSVAIYEKDRAQFMVAERLLRRSLQINENLFGLDHHVLAPVLNNLGWVLRCRGDLDGAIVHVSRALKIAENIRWPHPDVGAWTNNFAAMLFEKGDVEGAIRYGLKALEMTEGTYCANDFRTGVCANTLGMVFSALGDLNSAASYSGRAVQIGEKVFNGCDPQLAKWLGCRGSVALCQGELGSAFEYTERALDMSEKTFGPDHPETLEMQEELQGLKAMIGILFMAMRLKIL